MAQKLCPLVLRDLHAEVASSPAPTTADLIALGVMGSLFDTVQLPQHGRPILPVQCLEYYPITIRLQALLRIL